MNATALALSVNNLIDSFGNTVLYYAPNTEIGDYNDEGDWIGTWQTTVTSSRWIESDRVQSHRLEEMGKFHLKDGSMIMKNGSKKLVI